MGDEFVSYRFGRPESQPNVNQELRAEVYTAIDDVTHSMVVVVPPPTDGLAAADGRSMWYLCGFPRNCKTLMMCLSGTRPLLCFQLFM